MVTKAPVMLIWSVRSLAALAGLALASTKECDPIVLLVFLCFFILGIRINNLPRCGKVLSKLQPYLAVLVFGLSVVDFLFISQGFLLSVAHFLLLLQSLQLLILRTPRENLGGILISSLMILSASTLAMEWTFFVLFFLYVGGLVWALILHTLVLENNENESAWAERGFLWKEIQAPLWRSTMLAILSAVLCCIIVFVFFPRFNFQGFRGQFLQPVKKTGFTNQVDLAGSKTIYEDNSIAMRIELSSEDYSRWPGYIRGTTLELFDGDVWKRSGFASQRLFQTGRGEIPLLHQPSAYSDRLKQIIYMESLDSPLLFAIDQPAHLVIDRPFVETFSDGTLQRIQSDTWRLRYEVTSFLHLPRQSPPLAWDVSFPENFSPRLQQLAHELTTLSSTPREKAERIFAYFGSDFSYRLHAPASDDTATSLESFLFQVKQGHCEYFASALCLLFRSAGIPARMVTGFYSKEWNDRGKYIVVRMRHAHAWVEAYLPNEGWVLFDATPLQDESVRGAPGAFHRLNQFWDYLNLRWNRYILSYDFEQQRTFFESITRRSSTVSFQIKNIFGRWPRTSLSSPWLKVQMRGKLFFLLMLLGMVVVVVRRLPTSNTKKTVWFYQPLLKLLEKRGGKKKASQTLHEFVKTSPSFRRPSIEGLNDLIDKYQEFRFGLKTTVSGEESAKIKIMLQTLRKSN